MIPVPGDNIPVLFGTVPPFGVLPSSDTAERSHPIGEHNGYTWYHLPVRSCNPPAFKKPEANLAIFAARMAFSNFTIRSRRR